MIVTSSICNHICTQLVPMRQDYGCMSDVSGKLSLPATPPLAHSIIVGSRPMARSRPSRRQLASCARVAGISRPRARSTPHSHWHSNLIWAVSCSCLSTSGLLHLANRKPRWKPALCFTTDSFFFSSPPLRARWTELNENRLHARKWVRFENAYPISGVFYTYNSGAQINHHFNSTLHNLTATLTAYIGLSSERNMIYRVGQKNRTVFWKFVTPVYVDIE